MKIELLIIALLGMVSGELFGSNNQLLSFFAPCLILYSGMTRGSLSGLISAVFATIVIAITFKMTDNFIHVSNKALFLYYIQAYILTTLFLFATLIARRETINNKANQLTGQVKWISLGIFFSIASTVLSLFFCAVFIYYKFEGVNYIHYLTIYITNRYDTVMALVQASSKDQTLDIANLPKDEYIQYVVSYFPIIIAIPTIFIILIQAKLSMLMARVMKRLLRPNLGFENAVIPYVYSIFFVIMVVLLLCLNLYKHYNGLHNYDDVKPFTYSMIRIMLVPYFFYSVGFIHTKLKRMNTFLPLLVYIALFISWMIFVASRKPNLSLNLVGYLIFFFVHSLHGVYRNLFSTSLHGVYKNLLRKY